MITSLNDSERRLMRMAEAAGRSDERQRIIDVIYARFIGGAGDKTARDIIDAVREPEKS